MLITKQNKNLDWDEILYSLDMKINIKFGRDNYWWYFGPNKNIRIRQPFLVIMNFDGSHEEFNKWLDNNIDRIKMIEHYSDGKISFDIGYSDKLIKFSKL